MDFDAYLRGLQQIYAQMQVELRVRPAASPAALGALAAAAGGALDSGLVEAWSVADGTASPTPFFARPRFLTPFDFISTDAAVRQRLALERRSTSYREYTQAEARDIRIGDGWFQAGWVPFAQFGGGTLLLLSDMSPAAPGTAGQVIGFVHDPDEIVFVAASFREFLAASLQALDEDRDEYFFV